MFIKLVYKRITIFFNHNYVDYLLNISTSSGILGLLVLPVLASCDSIYTLLISIQRGHMDPKDISSLE